MIDTHWFQNRLADRRITQRALARHLGLDPAAVSLTLHGKRKLTAQEAAELAVVLDVEVGDVLARAGLTRSHRGGNFGAGVASRRVTGDVAVCDSEDDGAACAGRMCDGMCGTLLRGEGVRVIDHGGGGGKGAGAGVREDVLEVSVPLAQGGVVRLVLPRGLTPEDAERIATMVRVFAGSVVTATGAGLE